MINLEWFVRTMKRTFNVRVNRENIEYETYEVYDKQSNEGVIPKQHLTKLPDSIFFEIFKYVDENHNQWTLKVANAEKTQKKVYELWIKNGSVIVYDLYME